MPLFQFKYHRPLLLTALLAALLMSTPAEARNVKAELAAKQAEHAKLEQKSKKLSGQVDDLKQKLVNTTKVLRDTEDTATEGDLRLKSLKNERAEAVESLYKDHTALGGLVTAAQKYKRTSTPQMLLMANPLDAARASLIMKSLIPVLAQQSDSLKKQLTDLAELEDSINSQRDKQSRQYQKLNKQQDDLQKLLNERQAIYQKTEASRKTEEDEMEKLAQQARNLEDLVDRIKPKTRVASMASFPPNTVPPVTGIVKTGFGQTDDLGALSQGITFETRPGGPVVTPLAGTVRFAGPFQKYKQILIVEHAGGYHSLIAGLGRIDTVVGATLAAGEPVGIAETSQTGPRIYYELRQGGEPVNPRQLLVAQRKQDKS